MASAADGSVWVVETGPRLQLVHVGADGAISSFAVPGAGFNGADAQCMTVASDGIVWLAGTEPSSIVRFDPSTRTARQLATPTAAATPTEVAAGSNGVVWFDERATHSVARVDPGGVVTEYHLPQGVTYGPFSLTVTPDGHAWAVATGITVPDPAHATTASQSIFEFDSTGALLHQLAAAESVVPAISVSLSAELIVTGPGGLPFLYWGPYPTGVDFVSAGGSVQHIAYAGGDPTALVVGPDNRLWFVIPNTNEQNYGYIEPGTFRETAFHAPKGVSPGGITSGPGSDVSFTAADNYLYVVNTGISVGATSPGLQPSSISASLPTPAQAFANAGVVVTSAALAIGGTLFITFPAQLFNLTLQENYPTIVAWFARRRHRDRVPGLNPPRPWLGFGLVVAVGALFGSLLDPAFGRSWSTVANYLALVLALVTAAIVSGAVTAAYHWRVGHPERPRPHALPLGLAVAAVCVLVSRLASFEPGYLYGVVCSLAFARRLTAREEGRVAALATLATLCVSVLAWLLWVPAHNAATQPGAWFGAVVVDNFLAAVFVSGLVGSAIGLLPLRFLTGGAIRQWRPLAWASLFTLALFGIVDFLVRSPVSKGSPHAPLVTTVVLFVVFGGVAVGFREYFARRWRTEHGVTVRGLRQRARDLLTAHVAAPAPSPPAVDTAPAGDRPAGGRSLP